MFTFGFYNSKNGDRKYNAAHLGKIFDGVIQDGVFGTIHATDKNPFQIDPTATYPTLSLMARINKGKAWLAHTWNYLDSATNLTFSDVNAQYKRTDTVCIEVNNSYTAEGFYPRTNGLVIVQGSPVAASAADAPPLLTEWQKKNTSGEVILWRFPIANVTIYGTETVSGNVTYHAHTIESVNIKTLISPDGAEEANKYATWTPLVTGATMDASDYVPSTADFQAVFDSLIDRDTAAFNEWFDELHALEVEDPTAQAAITALNTKIDNKILYGTGEPPATLDTGVVYFQIEE